MPSSLELQYINEFVKFIGHFMRLLYILIFQVTLVSGAQGLKRSRRQYFKTLMEPAKRDNFEALPFCSLETDVLWY